MIYESSSGVYPKKCKETLQQQEAIDAVRFVVKDLVEEIMKEKRLHRGVGDALRQFEQTLDNAILFAPVSIDGPRLATALDEVGKLSAWHELVQFGAEVARIRPASVEIPEKIRKIFR